MKSSILVKTMVLVAIVMLQFANEAGAVSFKMKNRTNQTYRMRVMDRGQWRDYVQVLPGSSVTVAGGVTRSDHNVELEVYENGQWYPVHTGQHGSRAFTRVAILKDEKGSTYLDWYDEMPVTHHLERSGWAGPIAKVAGRTWDVSKSAAKNPAVRAGVRAMGYNEIDSFLRRIGK
jgi:hypothetical protein